MHMEHCLNKGNEVKEIKFGGSHIDFLDGIRGLAVLFVLLSHTSNNGWHLLGANFAMSGKLGVWLFFILSSFLLTSQLLQAYKKGYFNLKFVCSYLTARFFRIYPLYALVLLLAIYYAHWFDLSRFWSMFFLTSTSHHLWAIPVEFKFYFLLPLMFVFFVFVCHQRLLLFVAPFFLFYLLFSPYGGSLSITNLISESYFSLWKHLPVFVLGFVIAVLHDRGIYPTKALTMIAWCCALISIPYATFYFFSIAGVDLDIIAKRAVAFGYQKELLMALLWSIVVLGCYPIVQLRRLFETKFIVFTGKISFSLYLLHYFLFPYIRSFDLPAWEKGWLLVLISYCIAYLSYKLIEEFGIKQGKKVISALGLRKEKKA